MSPNTLTLPRHRGVNSLRAARETVGVVGVGRMGREICIRLVERGFTLLATDTRAQTRTVVEQTGAEWVTDPTELAQRCHRIISVLPGTQEVQVLAGELLQTMRRGGCWIDLSTAAPSIADPLRRQATRRAIRLLDAPMGGGPAEARAGQLTLFIGGTETDVKDNADLTGALGARVLHVGQGGSGYLIKLLANALWFGQSLAVAEVLALAERAGLDPHRTRAALMQSAGTSRFLEREAATLIAGHDLESFSLAGCVQQIRALSTLARELEMPSQILENVADLYDQCLRSGHAKGELSAARWVARRAGAEFAGREA